MYPYQPPPPTPTPTRRPFYRRHKITTALGGLVLLTLVISVAASVGGSGNSNLTPAPSSSTSQAAVPAVESSPVVTTPTQTAPAMTGAEQQAVQSAQGYLDDGQGFSRTGLLGQLTSSYGEGFTKADAEFAIGYLKPDWNAQAVESAKGYLADGQGFSRTSLLQQLTSSYGEGFTEAQAEYAVNKVGL
jgi:hypothetical protein